MSTIINRKGDIDDQDKPPRPPITKPKPPGPSHSNLGGSPGLVTSTGGLYGDKHALVIPFYDTKYHNVSLHVIEPSDFNTEEDAFYYFMSPDVSIARQVTIHQVAVIYREIGVATFSIGVIVYNRKTDSFKFSEVPVVIKNTSPGVDIVNFAFPDQKLHTRYIDLKITGERPQLYIKRMADSGPLSIISLTMAGHKDVLEIM